jgi:hypothetical protein
MAEGKNVKLKIGADTSALTASLRQASAATKMFGTELTSANKGMASLLTTAKSGGGLGNALGGGLTTTVKNLGSLTQEVEKTSGAWQRFTQGQLGQLNSLALKLGGIGIAVKLVGDYFSDAFNRSKTDPALEGLDRIRGSIERIIGSTDDWKKAIDRVVGAIANAAANHFNIETDTHSKYVATRERAQARDLARSTMERMGFRFTGNMTPEQRQMFAMLERQHLNQLGDRSADAWRSQFGGEEEIAQILPVAPPPQRRGGATPSGPTGWSSQLIGQTFRRENNLAAGAGRGTDIYGTAFAGAGGTGFNFSDALGATGPGGQFAGIFDSMTAKMNEVSEASTAMFGTLSSGLSAGIDALISGQENAGKAALRATAMTLRGMAVEYGVRALAAVFIPGMQGSAAGLAAAAAAAGAGSALLSSLAGGGGGGGGSSVPSSASYAMTRMGPSVPTNVTYNLTGTSHYGSPAKAYEIIQRGETAAAAAGTGSMRSYQLESFD